MKSVDRVKDRKVVMLDTGEMKKRCTEKAFGVFLRSICIHSAGGRLNALPRAAITRPDRSEYTVDWIAHGRNGRRQDSGNVRPLCHVLGPAEFAKQELRRCQVPARPLVPWGALRRFSGLGRVR